MCADRAAIWRVRLPVHRGAFELFKDGVDAGRLEETDGIFGVFVEVGVENALLDLPAVVADLFFRSGFDLGNEGEPVTRRCPRVKYPSLGMAIALGELQSLSVAIEISLRSNIVVSMNDVQVIEAPSVPGRCRLAVRP
jgi:hypothetical protein